MICSQEQPAVSAVAKLCTEPAWGGACSQSDGSATPVSAQRFGLKPEVGTPSGITDPCRQLESSSLESSSLTGTNS